LWNCALAVRPAREEADDDRVPVAGEVAPDRAPAGVEAVET
jgi:hypothetical protein